MTSATEIQQLRHIIPSVRKIEYTYIAIITRTRLNTMNIDTIDLGNSAMQTLIAATIPGMIQDSNSLEMQTTAIPQVSPRSRENEKETITIVSKTPGRSFVEVRRHVHSEVLLDETFQHHPTPPGLRANLMLHQQTILSAMLSLESIGAIRGDYSLLDHSYSQISTCMGLLSEAFGSGKTIMVLALLVAKPTPDNRTIYHTIPNPRVCPNRALFNVKKTFSDGNIIRPAIIFVATSVLLQWKRAVAKFTDLKYMTVSNVRDLRVLYLHIMDGTINDFDMVIVKNGNITGDFTIHGYVEQKNTGKMRKLYNVIANITRKYCWSRVIIDDYDIIKLPIPTAHMNGLFTWFISATSASRSTIKRSDNSEHHTAIDALTYHDIDLRELTASNYMNRALSIRNDPAYTEQSIAAGIPAFWVHSVVNKNKKYVQMIGHMEIDDANAIMEMLNGDAISTAAERAGIDSNDITDIFKQILQTQYDTYTTSIKTISWIDNIDTLVFGNLDSPPEGDVYHQKDIFEHRPIDFNYPDLAHKLITAREVCEEKKKKSGIAIDRVKDNINEGDCPVCCGELAGDDAIIVKCCGQILCADCGIHGTNLRRIGGAVQGKCPNCRVLIAFTDLIFIAGDFDLDTIKTNNGLDLDGTDEPIATAPCITKDDTKADVLLRIIRGEANPKKKEISVSIPGIIEGIRELPTAPIHHRKTIIFSKFEEHLNGIEQKLKDGGIVFHRLRSTAETLDKMVCDFHDSYDGANVLLINGEKYSSGCNLQSATDLVFMHRIMDQSIEAQIAGRILRPGRIYKANIHYVLYGEESRHLHD